MDSYSFVAGNFVEGNVQKRFVAISLALKQFIDIEAPIIAATKTMADAFYNKPLVNIDRRKIEEFTRRDAEEARKSLTVYNRTFGTIDHHLAMMRSNYQLPQFLAECGVPAHEISTIQQEIRRYWEATYGLLLNKFHQIHGDMEQLRNILEKEVRIIESFPNASYFTGFERSGELNFLFEKEQQLFWKIVKETNFTKEELSQAEGVYQSQRTRIKETLLAHAKMLKSIFKEDLAGSENKTQKALLFLIYMLGALNLYFDLKRILIGKSTKFLGRYLKKKESGEKWKVLAQKSGDTLANLTPESLSELAGMV